MAKPVINSLKEKYSYLMHLAVNGAITVSTASKGMQMTL